MREECEANRQPTAVVCHGRSDASWCHYQQAPLSNPAGIIRNSPHDFGYIETGSRLFLERRSQSGEDFKAFLKHVRAHYRSQPIMMLLDENSSHTANSTRAFADKLRIRFLFLPKRSPKLNPMDHLWRCAKKEISSLHQYRDIDEHILYFLEYLEQMSNYETLLKAGILSEYFWLDS